MPRRALAVLVAIVTAAALFTVPTSSPAGAAPAQPGCTDPFTAAFRARVAERFPGQRVTAAVYDTRTGCWYHLEPGMQITTASVIKAQFLAGILLRAQDEGRGMTAWEQARVQPMMAYSHNPPASDLFVHLGGVTGMAALDQRFGIGATTHHAQWGVTASTATDRTKVALALLHGGGPIGNAGRDQAWQVMSSVHPTQQWGITAGVPRGWSVALKNGFYPASGPAQWRLGSSGFVRHDASGQGYAITVMSDRNPDHDTGQRLVEMVSRRVATELAGSLAAARAVDRSICASAQPGETWAAVAARVGTGDVAGVQRVAGGIAHPVAGMRVCNPALFDPGGAAANFVRATFRTFLGRSPNAAELRPRAVALDAGAMSRHAVAHELAQSPEWISRTIDELYRSALGRPAEPAGLRYWRDLVVGGLRITDVGAELYAAAEFYQRSGGTDRDFVGALYAEILGRAPDASGLTYWLDVLDAGTPRRVVTSSFYASVESRRDRVARTYASVLGRGPDPGGHAYWADVLVGDDDVALAAHLAASDEYLALAQR